MSEKFLSPCKKLTHFSTRKILWSFCTICVHRQWTSEIIRWKFPSSKFLPDIYPPWLTNTLMSFADEMEKEWLSTNQHFVCPLKSMSTNSVGLKHTVWTVQKFSPWRKYVNLCYNTHNAIYVMEQTRPSSIFSEKILDSQDLEWRTSTQSPCRTRDP